ncbi:MAG: hypothetical protein ACI30K_05585, partial [Muribaculaceae bacterium]
MTSRTAVSFFFLPVCCSAKFSATDLSSDEEVKPGNFTRFDVVTSIRMSLRSAEPWLIVTRAVGTALRASEIAVKSPSAAAVFVRSARHWSITPSDSGEINDVTLQQINEYINDSTPRNRYGRPLSQRLPQGVERALYARTPENR